MASSSRSATPLSTSPRYPSSRVHDAVQVAPYLTHVVRHHGQITLIPPENAARIRKAKKKRPATARAANSSGSLERPRSSAPRSRSNTPRPHSSMTVREGGDEYRNSIDAGPSRRRVQDDLCIPDFPPPSFEEAMRATQSPPDATSDSQARIQPSNELLAENGAGERERHLSPVVAAEEEPSQEESTPSSPSSSHSSLEETIESRPRSLWEQDREAGYSLEERVQRELERRRLADSLPRAPVMRISDRVEQIDTELSDSSSTSANGKPEEASRAAGKSSAAPRTTAASIPVREEVSSFVSQDDLRNDHNEELEPSTGSQSAGADKQPHDYRPLPIPPSVKGKEREVAIDPSIIITSHLPLPNGKRGESSLSPLRPQHNIPVTTSSDIGIQRATTSNQSPPIEQSSGPSASHPSDHEASSVTSSNGSDMTANAVSSPPSHPSTSPCASTHFSSLQPSPSTISAFSRSSRPLPIPPPSIPLASEPSGSRAPLAVSSAGTSVRERISAFEALQSRPIPPPPPLRRIVRRPPPPVSGPSNSERTEGALDARTGDGDPASASVNDNSTSQSRSGGSSLPRRRRTPPPVPPSSFRRRRASTARIQVDPLFMSAVPPPSSTPLFDTIALEMPTSRSAANGALTGSNLENSSDGGQDDESNSASNHADVAEASNDTETRPRESSETCRVLPLASDSRRSEDASVVTVPSGFNNSGVQEEHAPPIEMAHSEEERRSMTISGLFSSGPSDSATGRSSEPSEHREDVPTSNNPGALSQRDESNANGAAQIRPLQPMFTGPTDLDLLLARLDDPDFTYGGRSYDDLLLLEEIMGPAFGASGQQRTSFEDIPLGRVEVLRRRVTKDGRTKLKLALLGVLVDKCGICLAQFKGDVFACLLPCRHAFHENCLRLWMRRGQTCPLCRGPLCVP